MVWPTTSHQDNTKDDETDNGDDFQTGEPEFEFTKYSGAEEVDGENED